MLSDEAHDFTHGAVDSDLWPVTLNAPGRVAKLKAVGNAVVPAWVVAGPFAEILRQEAHAQMQEAA